MTPTPVLALADISVRIADKTLVDRVSLAAPAGTVTALVGPNGAGKSTLIAVAAGTRRPSAGQVLYDGRPIGDWAPWRLAAKRAVMVQAAPLAFPFAVHEVVRIGLDGIGRGLTEPDRLGILARSLAAADVAALAPRLYPTLSGGEQQRVRFARALAQIEAGATVETRQVLILDEPIASLDLKHQFALMDAARAAAARGLAVLVVLHDLALARSVADRIVVLRGGAVAAEGPAVTTLTDVLVADVFEVPPERWREIAGGPGAG